MTDAQVSPAADQLSKEDMEKQFKEWAREQYVAISKFCSTKGHQVIGLDQSKCQSLPPVLGIWYVKTDDKKIDLWVISGDFPTDIANSGVAKDARDAIRYFSMAWHIQAAKLEDGVAEGRIELKDKETQSNFAQQLTKRAESLYEIYNSEKLWANTGLTMQQ